MTDEMTCSAMEEKIPLLVYDELPEEEAATVKAHLEQCGTCKASFDELSESASFLEESTTSMPPLTLSDEERSHILTSILEGAVGESEQKGDAASTGKKTAGMPPVVWVIIIAAILGLAAILYHLLKG